MQPDGARHEARRLAPRRLRPYSLLLVGGIVAPPALAQHNRSLQFTQQLEQAVALAKQSDRPLLCYVLNRGRRDNDDRRQRHSRMLRDPRVQRAASRFICVEVATPQHADLAAKWELEPDAHRRFVFVTPSGDALLSRYLENEDTFVQAADQAYESYLAQVYDERLGPALANREAPAREILQALRRVRSLQVEEADFAVCDLLRRPALSAELRRECFATLAVLSTPPAVDALLSLSRAEPAALAALADCTPAGAERLLEALVGDDDALRGRAYEAIVKICPPSRPKGARFWQTADREAQRQEVGRIRAHVRACAAAWRAAPQ